MSITRDIQSIFDESLGLEGATTAWTEDTALLGAIPELDSLAVTTVIFALEEHYSIVFGDDELGAEVFATVGTLKAIIESKLAQEADRV